MAAVLPLIMIRSPAAVDRISSLPDEVLCHILSFLTTQQAVATSALSKRWRHLWSSVSTLDFDHQIYLRNGKSSFERRVYATIIGRDAQQQPITRFRLRYDALAAYDFDQSNADVNAWVNTAIRRGIENLDIEILRTNYVIRLSSCIFSCRTLVVLRLKCLSVGASSSFDLPSLKSLHLELVRFLEPQCLMELLYGCPMLEDLIMDNIDCDHDDACVCKEGFKLPKLVRADLRFLSHADILLKAICNVQFLTIKQSQVDMATEFPHLRHLGLSMAVNDPQLALLMLNNCPKLQSFKFRGSFHQVLPYPPSVVPECLTSHFKMCHLKYQPGTESDLQFAKYILQNSTSLQSMKVHCVSLNIFAQLEVLKELALCSRKSTSCELSFL